MIAENYKHKWRCGTAGSALEKFEDYFLGMLEKFEDYFLGMLEKFEDYFLGMLEMQNPQEVLHG